MIQDQALPDGRASDSRGSEKGALGDATVRERFPELARLFRFVDQALPDGRASGSGRASDSGRVSGSGCASGGGIDVGCNRRVGGVSCACASVGVAPWSAFVSKDRDPVAYFITFTTYGTWLHGDRRGSVDPEHNIYDTSYVAPDPRRQRCDGGQLRHPPVLLNNERRGSVDRAIREVCRHRGWELHALNVRTNHVHIVVSAPDTPERAMNSFKSWATRKMIEADHLTFGTKAWARHGSTRYLWNEDQLETACLYVAEGQGADL